MTTLWDTSGTDVVKALDTERRLHGAVSSGLALTLVVVVDEKRVAEAEQAATRAAAQHPCRLLVVVRRRPDAPEPRLDAEVLIGGRLGPGEAVVMRMYGRLALHAESVVLPLLAPDAPVVAWWFGEPPTLIAHDPLGVFADRRVTHVGCASSPLAALSTRARDYVPGDTDLAWSRITSWRGLCAAAFDAITSPVTAARVAGAPDNAARALLAGWLSASLDVTVEQSDAQGPDNASITEVGFTLQDGSVIALTRGKDRLVTVEHTGHPERIMPLAPRGLGDLLAEELKRLDADEIYAEALAALHPEDFTVGRAREHIWIDPAEHAESNLVAGKAGNGQ